MVKPNQQAHVQRKVEVVMQRHLAPNARTWRRVLRETWTPLQEAVQFHDESPRQLFHTFVKGEPQKVSHSENQFGCQLLHQARRSIRAHSEPGA